VQGSDMRDWHGHGLSVSRRIRTTVSPEERKFTNPTAAPT
jgi:hypothetical protein